MKQLRILADENIPRLQEFFQPLGEVRTAAGRTLTAAQLSDIDVLLVRSVTRVDEALLRQSPVRFVGTCTIGTDHLDTDYLQRAGIRYASAPGCNANSVVDYVFSVMARLRPDWLGRRVGIIGCGNVGGRLYRRLQGLGVDVRGYDPLLPVDSLPRQVSLEDALQADVVCLHTPLTRSGPHPSWHLLDESRLRQLRPGCLLINAGRGAAVDNRALKQVLQDRDDLTAVLDVWEPEPCLDLELLPLVTLASPHIAGYSLEGKVEGTAMIYRALCDYLQLPGTRQTDDLLSAGEAVVELKQTLITDNSASLQSCLNRAILKVYDVMADDLRLRQSLLQPECQQSREQLASRFDYLRKHYPQRREFSAFQVRVSQTLQQRLVKAGEWPALAQQLAALGFAGLLEGEQ